MGGNAGEERGRRAGFTASDEGSDVGGRHAFGTVDGARDGKRDSAVLGRNLPARASRHCGNLARSRSGTGAGGRYGALPHVPLRARVALRRHETTGAAPHGSAHGDGVCGGYRPADTARFRRVNAGITGVCRPSFSGAWMLLPQALRVQLVLQALLVVMAL